MPSAHAHESITVNQQRMVFLASITASESAMNLRHATELEPTDTQGSAALDQSPIGSQVIGMYISSAAEFRRHVDHSDPVADFQAAPP